LLKKVDAGRWVAPKKEPLTEALRELLDMSQESRAAMGRRGRDLVLRNYTKDIAAHKMIFVYQCILEGKDIPIHPEPAKV